MLLRLKDFEEADDARVTNFLENVDLLEDLASGVLILDVDFVNAFDGHVLSSEFVNAKRDFAEGTFAKKLDKFVEVQRRVGDLPVLSDVRFDVADQFVAVFRHRVVEDDVGACSSARTIFGRRFRLPHLLGDH